MKEEILIKKRNGQSVPLDLEKIHKVVEYAVEGLDNVSVSTIEMKSQLQFFDGMTTKEIQSVLIKGCADLISTETPNYQYVAARLQLFDMYKESELMIGETDNLLMTTILNNVRDGFYTPELLEKYTIEEIEYFHNCLEPDRDMNFSYAGLQQFRSKYLIRNRVTDKYMELPQIAYMVIAMTGFIDEEDKEARKKYVKDLYDALSLFKISLPTPIMAGLRTPIKQFSSCVVVDCGDSIDSITATSSAVVKYIAKKAGIGLNMGAIRAVDSPIRGGDSLHTGNIPFYKLMQASVGSCNQGGVRSGAATVHWPIWHYEFENLIVLKNNKGTEDNRVRHLDYSVQISETFYKRLIQGKNITFFSPSEVPGLYEAFFRNDAEFEKLYEKYEADPSIRRKSLRAVDVFATILKERSATGRIYIQHIDHVNKYGPFDPDKAPVRMSNLCQEIAIPTIEMAKKDEDENDVGLINNCTLAALNVGALEDEYEYQKYAYILVRLLDNILTYQEYPVPEAERGVKQFRPLGIGIINLANLLARKGLKYSDGSANNTVHELMEMIQYYLLEASISLAKERGTCESYEKTKYAKGLLPIDRYKEFIDTKISVPLKMDWELLRSKLKEYGLRNSTLSAIAPTETSSILSNSTNGIEQPRSPVSVKLSKGGVVKQVVPDYENLKDQYEYLWDNEGNEGYLTLVGIMQKFVDQSISANTKYDPKKHPKGMVPMDVLLGDLLLSYKLGIKNLYYHNTLDHSGANDEREASKSEDKVKSLLSPTTAYKPKLGEVIEVEDEGCSSGACKI